MISKSTFKINFVARSTKKNKNGEIPVCARVTINGLRAEISLGYSILPKLWNPKKGYATGSSKEAKRLNEYIDVVRGQVYQHHKQLVAQDKLVSAENIKKAFLGLEDDTKYIIQIYREHNAKCKELIGNGISLETYKRYQTCLRHTERFIKLQYNKQDLPVQKVNYGFLTNYEHYYKAIRGCSHNSTMKYMKNFKKIILIALANDWITKNPFANYKITFKKVDRDFLNEEELTTLMNKELHCDRLRQVRDCFIFSCFSGLAYCDLKSLTSDSIKIGIDGKKWIMTRRRKTNNSCNIPLLPIADTIIKKYKNHPDCIDHDYLLPVIAIQNMNAYLKEIAVLCGIKKDLTTHVARHTFATTVTLNNNVPIETVSKMLGHSSINMTKVYARLLDKKVSQDMGHLYEKY